MSRWGSESTPPKCCCCALVVGTFPLDSDSGGSGTSCEWPLACCWRSTRGPPAISSTPRGKERRRRRSPGRGRADLGKEAGETRGPLRAVCAGTPHVLLMVLLNLRLFRSPPRRWPLHVVVTVPAEHLGVAQPCTARHSISSMHF